MNEPTELALSQTFMRSHPVQAARVLETLTAQDCAAVFERAPARIGSAVIAAMQPRPAARCLAELSDERLLALLAPIGTQATVALLLLVPPARRHRLVARLPTAAALASSLLLGYTDDSLGAWADPDVIAVPADTRADEALARLRDGNSTQGFVYVNDAEQRLCGEVALPLLLRAAPSRTLAVLMLPPTALLAAQASLASARNHPGWQQCSVMPVVDPARRLVGAISRDGLERALRRSDKPPPTLHTDSSLSMLLVKSAWQSMAGIMGVATALLPPVQPLGSPRRRNHGR